MQHNNLGGVNGLWQTILQSLDGGQTQFNGVATHVAVTSARYSCQPCARRVFRDMIYTWRKNVPATSLPASVKNRPDCHWGKNCRTQQHKPDHAKHYNHVCEQTRFA